MFFCSMARHATSICHLKSGSEALMTVSTSCDVAIAGCLALYMSFQRCWLFGQSPSIERRAERLRRGQASCRTEASQSPEAICLLSPPARPSLCRYYAASFFCCAIGQFERPQPRHTEAFQDGKPCQLVTPNRTLKMPGRWVMKACVLRIKTHRCLGIRICMGAQESLPTRKRIVTFHLDIAYGQSSFCRRKVCHVRPKADSHTGAELERPTPSALYGCHTTEQQFQ